MEGIRLAGLCASSPETSSDGVTRAYLHPRFKRFGNLWTGPPGARPLVSFRGLAVVAETGTSGRYRYWPRCGTSVDGDGRYSWLATKLPTCGIAGHTENQAWAGGTSAARVERSRGPQTVPGGGRSGPPGRLNSTVGGGPVGYWGSRWAATSAFRSSPWARMHAAVLGLGETSDSAGTGSVRVGFLGAWDDERCARPSPYRRCSTPLASVERAAARQPAPAGDSAFELDVPGFMAASLA